MKKASTGAMLPFLSGGGEMGERIRAFDWTCTPLGPPFGWPQSLRSTVGLLLSTQQPMFIWWGPELIQMYNDPYRATMGPERHPSALGQKGRECWDEIWPIIGPQIEQVLHGGAVWQEDALVPVTRHGKRAQVWWTYSYNPIRDESGGVGGVLVICNDVTRAHEVHEALKVSEERLAFALESAGGLGTWDWDVVNDKLYANEKFAEFFAVEPKAARAGAPLAAFLGGIYPADLDALKVKIDAAMAHGGDYQAEYRVVGFDRRIRWLMVRGYCAHDREGRPVRFGGVATDTTELHQTMDALNDANRRQTEFLATLAHELRNPLAPLRSGLEVIELSKSNPASIEKTRAMMQRQLDHLVRLVDDLMDINRVSQGKVELRRENVMLTEVVHQAIETARPVLERYQHHLITKFPTVAVTVEGDITRLVQIVSNLLNNAAKYTDPGGEIRIEVDSDGGDAVLRVIDNGIGIPAPMLPRVFEMFTQVENGTARSRGGLGIGLSLVKALATLHGGSVHAHSAGEGKGSEFVIRLPGVSADTRLSAASATPNRAVPTKRILVVDDNRDAAVSLVQVLELLGHEAHGVFSGADALTEGPQFNPDIVFLDIGMPVLDGYGCARQIRQSPWGQRVILVALTGWGQDEDREKSAHAGFDHHLVKPVDLDAVNALLMQA